MIGLFLLKRRQSSHAAVPQVVSLPVAAPAPVAAPVDYVPTVSVASIPDWLVAVIQRNAPPDLAGNPDFIRVVAAGAKAESGWNPRAVQLGGGGRGLFQFDIFGGMGTGVPDETLFDPDYQAARIVPQYATFYRQNPANGDAGIASWIAGQAERPYDYQNPNSTARRNYADAYRGLA